MIFFRLLKSCVISRWFTANIFTFVCVRSFGGVIVGLYTYRIVQLYNLVQVCLSLTKSISNVVRLPTNFKSSYCICLAALWVCANKHSRVCILQVCGGLVWILVASTHVQPNNPLGWVMFVSVFCFLTTFLLLITFACGMHKNRGCCSLLVSRETYTGM